MCPVGSQKLAYSPSTLAVVFRAGLFSFFSAKLGSVWPKSPLTGLGRVRSPPGVETLHTGPPEAEKPGAFPKGKDGYFVPEGFSRNKPWLVLPQGVSWGQTGALGDFVGRLAVGGFPKCREERRPQQGGSQPLLSFPRHLRHWW